MRSLLILSTCLLFTGCAGSADDIPVVGAPGSSGSSEKSDASATATTAVEEGGKDPQAILAQQDADGDGKLSGEEIPSWLLYTKAAFDSDNDGSISAEELEAGIGQFSPPSESGGGGRGGGGGGGGFDPTMMFANMDTNKDGKLTGDEISDRMRENMDATDTDSDGAITLEELEERIRQRRAARGGGGRRGGGANDSRPE